jgi:hypothetical protein
VCLPTLGKNFRPQGTEKFGPCRRKILKAGNHPVDLSILNKSNVKQVKNIK